MLSRWSPSWAGSSGSVLSRCCEAVSSSAARGGSAGATRGVALSGGGGGTIAERDTMAEGGSDAGPSTGSWRGALKPVGSVLAGV